MEKQQYDYGMVGLGTMGRNLVFNMNDHGYSVAGYDKDAGQVELFRQEAGSRNLFATGSIADFVGSLKSPRVILLLVPAGHIVDAVINELKPLLSKDDLLMDCGNSHYTDTNTRDEQLAKEHLQFMGVGISGGESGARYGPSIMPGGSQHSYERVAPMLKAVSAKVDNEPCVSWLGPGSAGHYVKMVHNGIEYGLMELIAEAYHLMKEYAGMNNDELHTVFSKWNEGILRSYLVEITAGIFLQKDGLTENRLIDMILDSAHQKGTGAWASEDAMDLQVPIPVIDTAVSVRDLSAYKAERVTAQKTLKGPAVQFTGDRNELINALEQALYFSFIITYAQGMALLHKASAAYKYNLKAESIAAIWQGGCIIRASLLKTIRAAFTSQPDLSNLVLSREIADILIKLQDSARNIIQTGVGNGIPLPAMMSSLAWYDGFRRGWLPGNLLQAQRDYFGAHTYERNDREGVFHTQWDQTKQ